MEIRALGRTGLKVTEVCLGTMTFGNQADQETSFAVMDTADEAGANFFDTADVYPLGGGPEKVGRTEEIVGAWLRERGARDRIVLATKCAGRTGPGPNDVGLNRKHIIEACEASLRRLGTDYIDLYQAHSPDPSTPIEETLEAFTSLIQAGKVRYIGCSNYRGYQLADALCAGRVSGLARYDSDQPRYNILFRMIEEEILPLCQANGLGVIVYNPLAGGMLTGRYKSLSDQTEGTRFGLERAGELYRRRYWNEAVIEVAQRLGQFMEGRGKSLTQVALAWVLLQPGITAAIVGASRPEQLRESLGGVGLTLDPEEIAAADEAWFALPRETDLEVARR